MSECEPTKPPMKDPAGDPDPSCFSSAREFRYRLREFLLKWRSIICC